MKLVFLLSLFLFPSLAFCTITQVQTKSNDTGTVTTATSLTITFDAATTSGNVVIVGVVSSVAGDALQVTSTHGIFYEATPVAVATGANPATYIFKGIIFGADTVITIALSRGGSFGSAVAATATEYSGLNIVPDAIPSTSNGSTGTPTTGALTNRDANALYVGVIGQRGFNSATENTSWASSPSSPFSIVGQITSKVNSGSVDKAEAFLEAIVSTTASRTASATSALGTLVSAGTLATFHETGLQPTPTATATFTPTNTPTATATSTATATFTPTATATASFTPCSCPATPTATATFTPTATATATDTPTPTATATASFTPCSCPATPTATATFTPTATSTATSTPTPTATATASYTPCICPATPTPTPTATATPTAPVETTGVFG